MTLIVAKCNTPACQTAAVVRITFLDSQEPDGTQKTFDCCEPCFDRAFKKVMKVTR